MKLNTKKSQISKLLILAVIGILFVFGFSSFALSLSFEPVQNLSANAGDSRHHQIAVSGSNVYVVWTDSTPGNYEVFFRRSIDGGATFDTVHNLSDKPAGVGYMPLPQVAVSGQNVYVVFVWPTNRDSEVIFRRSTDGGTTFEPAINLEEGLEISGHPRIAVDGSNVYVAWAGASGIVFRRSTDGGANFEPRQVLSGYRAGGPKLATSAGRVYVVWVESFTWFGNPEILFRLSVDDGASFETAINVSETPGYSYEPELAVMDSKVFVTWQENNDIFFRRSIDDGASFEPIVKLSDSATPSFTPELAVGGSNVYVVWQQWASPGGPGEPTPMMEIFFRRSTDGGATFEVVQNLSGSVVTDSRSPQVAADGSAVFVGWTEYTENWIQADILLRTSRDGGATFGPADDLSSNAGFSVEPEIAVQMPNVFVAWWDNTPGNNDIFFRRGVTEPAMDPGLKLAFPLKGTKPGRNENLGSNNASINSVFDHSMKNKRGDYRLYDKGGIDGIVTAFTNEVGEKRVGSGRGEFSDCYNQSSGLPFNITGNYTAPRNLSSKYLCYDNHPGYDYRADMKTEAYAAVSGTINYPQNIVGLRNPKGTAYNNFHVLELIPDDFPQYKIYYLHLDTHPSTKKNVTRNDTTPGCPSVVTLPLPNGTHVNKGCLIALTGTAGLKNKPHLHFEIQKVVPLNEVKQNAQIYLKCVDTPNKACVPVDPYGWEASALDPYFNLTNITNIRLWE